MNEQVVIQNLLRERLFEIQKQNSRFSLRAYAKKVGVHPGALSYILNGKRNVSRELAERITRRLLLDPQQRSEILSRFPEKRKYRKNVTSEDVIEYRYLELNVNQYKIAAEWEHFAVMSLIKCDDFFSSFEWIAKRLGISESRAKQVVDRLLQLELLTLESNGSLTRSEKSYRTPDDVADISLKKHHHQSMELAQESINRDSVSDRDFTTVTMAIDRKKLSTAKEVIRKFQDELSDLLEAGQRTDVYRLSVQLFPLTKIKTGEVK